MREGWANRIIGDCFTEIKNGASIQQKKGATGIPITRIETLSGSVFNRDRLGYADITALGKYSSFVLNDGDILMSHINSLAYIGRAVQYHKDGEETIIHGMNLLRLIPIRNTILPSFAEYYFKTDAFKWDIQGIANVSIHQASFNTKALKALSIPVPSIQEQQRIVDILDQEFAKIDALKANAEKSLQAAKDLFQATLKKELEPKEGWSINRLGDICTITSSKRIYKNEYVPDGIPFYRTKEVKEISNGRPISVELYISRERYNEIKQKFGVPQPNDILVSAVGTIGEMMIVRDNSPFYFKDGNLVWLKGITNADPEYLRYYLQSVINQIKGMTIGAAYSALTIEKFQEMEVALAPSLLEQQAIVSQLDDLNGKCKNLQDNYQKTLTLCDDLKQSLLRKAFNGEL